MNKQGPQETGMKHVSGDLSLLPTGAHDHLFFKTSPAVRAVEATIP